MFKQRLKELGRTILCLIGGLIFISLFAGFCIWLHAEKLFDWMQVYRVGIALTLLSALIIYFSWSFINWLFIQPYRAWRKSKNN